LGYQLITLLSLAVAVAVLIQVLVVVEQVDFVQL
jgi:hypothetical protein